MLPAESAVTTLINRAVDPDQTEPERAAALSAASRIASERNLTVDLPDPPPGWAWRDGRVVPLQPSGMVPPLRVQRRSWWGERAAADEAPVVEERVDEPTAEPIAPASQPEVPAALAGSMGSKLKCPPRPGSTAALILRLVRQPGGASPDEIMAETGASLATIRTSISVYARGEIVFDKATGHYVRAVAPAC